jgi:hypothetical protein
MAAAGLIGAGIGVLMGMTLSGPVLVALGCGMLFGGFTGSLANVKPGKG